MRNHQKVTGRASSIPGGLAVGAAASGSVTGLLTLLMALCLEKEIITWETAGYGIMIMIMLSAFLGSIIACTKIRHQQILVCLMSAGVYFAMLLSITALFFGGQYQAVGVTALLVVGGAICSALFVSGQGRGRRKFR